MISTLSMATLQLLKIMRAWRLVNGALHCVWCGHHSSNEHKQMKCCYELLYHHHQAACKWIPSPECLWKNHVFYRARVCEKNLLCREGTFIIAYILLWNEVSYVVVFVVMSINAHINLPRLEGNISKGSGELQDFLFVGVEYSTNPFGHFPPLEASLLGVQMWSNGCGEPCHGLPADPPIVVR